MGVPDLRVPLRLDVIDAHVVCGEGLSRLSRALRTGILTANSCHRPARCLLRSEPEALRLREPLLTNGRITAKEGDRN